MKGKKKEILFSVLLIVCLVLFIVYLMPSNKKQSNEKLKGKIVEEVIEDVFFDSSTSNKDFKKMFGVYLPSNETFWGVDSMVRQKPSKNVIKKYKLEKYETLQNQYAEKLEKKIKDNTSYKFIENTENKVRLAIIPWYYYQYSNDLTLVRNALFEYEGYEYDESDLGTEEYKAYDYKARTLATRIMDSHLDAYDNKEKETRTVSIYYTRDNPGEDEYYTLYMVLAGVTAKRGPSDNQREERVKSYIEEAKQNGILDENKPLEIIG